MQIKRKAICGSENKGDIRVAIEPGQQGLEINISSTYGKQFYTQIAETVNNIINKCGIINAKINILDNGALDFVVKARMESAIMKGSREMEKKYYFDKPYIKYKLRRTQLFIPGNNPYFMKNIQNLKADGIILDLEDSVPIEEKESARILVKHALNKIDFGRAEKMVKINTLDICGVEDIEEIIESKPDILLIPKCETEYDVKKVLEHVERSEKKYQLKLNQIKLIPIIETAKGVENTYSIATATNRVIMLAFGSKNYISSMGINRTDSEDELEYARKVIVNTAKSIGIQASDTIYSNTNNIEGLRKSTEKIKAMGFDGKGAIHPSQIKIIHNVFMPDEKEIEYSKEIIDIYNKSKDQGSGVMKYKGKMIDMAIVIRAIRVSEICKAMSQQRESND